MMTLRVTGLFFVVGILFLSLGTCESDAQTWSKATSIGSPADESVSRLVVDGEGNKIVAGSYAGTITFGSQVLLAPRFPGIYLAKFDASDRVIWARALAVPTDSFESVSALGLVVTRNGNIYVGGNFETLLGDGTPYGMTFEDTTMQGVGASAMYLAKLSSDGSREWVRSMSQPGLGSFGKNSIEALTAGPDESVFITGSYNTNALLDTIKLTSSNTSEAFVARFTSSGRVVWARSGQSEGPASGLAIGVDSSGQCYATGTYFVDMRFDSIDLPAGNAEQKIYVTRIAQNGSLDWAERLGSGGYYGAAYDMAIAPDGHPLLTGFYRSDITLGDVQLVYNNGLRYAALLVKLDTSGQPEWAVASEGSNQHAIAYAISAASDGSSWITGSCHQVSRFGAFPFVDTNASNGHTFIAHVSSDGKFLWADQLGNQQNEGDAVAALRDGGCTLAGTFSGSMTIGSNVVNSAGGYDIYLAEASAASDVKPNISGKTEAVYPNPAQVFIHLPNATASFVRLADQAGREFSRASRAGRIDISDLPPGVYHIIAGTESFSFIKDSH